MYMNHLFWKFYQENFVVKLLIKHLSVKYDAFLKRNDSFIFFTTGNESIKLSKNFIISYIKMVFETFTK